MAKKTKVPPKTTVLAPTKTELVKWSEPEPAKLSTEAQAQIEGIFVQQFAGFSAVFQEYMAAHASYHQAMIKAAEKRLA